MQSFIVKGMSLYNVGPFIIFTVTVATLVCRLVKIDPSGVEMVSSFVSISADEGVEIGFLTDFFSTACV
jgi:hypothetical protein